MTKQIEKVINAYSAAIKRRIEARIKKCVEGYAVGQDYVKGLQDSITIIESVEKDLKE